MSSWPPACSDPDLSPAKKTASSNAVSSAELHQHHITAHHVADGAGQERIVGAAQEQRVHFGVAHGRQEALGQHVDLIRVSLAALDELHEPGTGGAGRARLRRPSAISARAR